MNQSSKLSQHFRANLIQFILTNNKKNEDIFNFNLKWLKLRLKMIKLIDGIKMFKISNQS